jgi:hypothetical protein
LHKEIFLSAGFQEEYFFRKMQYLEFVILSKEVEDDNILLEKANK